MEQAFEWQQKYAAWVKLVRKVYEDDATATWDRDAQNASNALRQELDDLEYAWSPPPHKCPWKTPVPPQYYTQAAGAYAPWNLSTRWSADLVPVEQTALVQDVLLLPEMESIHTADARACISLCRPHGHYVERRKLPQQRGLITTQMHQSGELSLRPLTPDEDNLRGMLTGLVATPECLASNFKLRAEEAQVPDVDDGDNDDDDDDDDDNDGADEVADDDDDDDDDNDADDDDDEKKDAALEKMRRKPSPSSSSSSSSS